MPFDPSWPPTNAELESAPTRNQFNSLKALIDGLQAQVNGLLPIGIVIGYAKNLASLPALPGTWAECNGQVLNDSESPLDGATLPDLNVTQRFLRGSVSSGDTGGTERHTHGFQSGVGALSGGEINVAQNQFPGTTEENHLPPYYELVFIIRVR